MKRSHWEKPFDTHKVTEWVVSSPAPSPTEVKLQPTKVQSTWRSPEIEPCAGKDTRWDVPFSWSMCRIFFVVFKVSARNSVSKRISGCHVAIGETQWSKTKTATHRAASKIHPGLYLDLFSRCHHSLVRACVCFVWRFGPVDKWRSVDVGQNKSDDPAPPQGRKLDAALPCFQGAK